MLLHAVRSAITATAESLLHIVSLQQKDSCSIMSVGAIYSAMV